MTHQRSVTVILARGGSKGVLDKNLRLVGGLPLIARAVRAARGTQTQSAVYVSTDSASIAETAQFYGARVIQRPVDISGDNASSEAGWLHALPHVRADFPDVKQLVFLQCTSPFITASDIDACVSARINAKAACALSVVEDHGFLWGIDENGLGVGQNHDHRSQRSRRQDLPPQYRENGAIYCVDAEAFETTGLRFCGTVALCPVDQPALEIDSYADLNLANLMAKQADTPALERLLKVRALVMDFDGVHTDNLVTTDQNGHESVTTSRGDGMGLEELHRRTDIKRIIVSKERNPVVLARARKLGIDVTAAVDDKVALLENWLEEQGLTWAQVLYVGNDVNDIGPIEKAGLAACPSDAHRTVLNLVDWVLPNAGGRGALRDLCDTLIEAQISA